MLSPKAKLTIGNSEFQELKLPIPEAWFLDLKKS